MKAYVVRRQGVRVYFDSSFDPKEQSIRAVQIASCPLFLHHKASFSEEVRVMLGLCSIRKNLLRVFDTTTAHLAFPFSGTRSFIGANANEQRVLARHLNKAILKEAPQNHA